MTSIILLVAPPTVFAGALWIVSRMIRRRHERKLLEARIAEVTADRKVCSCGRHPR